MSDDAKAKGKEKKSREESGDSDVVSLSDIDDILDEDDPEFNKSLDAIAEDTSLNDADIDPTDSDNITVDEEEEVSHLELLIERFPQLARVIAVKDKALAFIKRRITNIKLTFSETLGKGLHVLKNDLPGQFNRFKVLFKSGFSGFVESVKKSKEMTLQQKMALGGGFVLIGLVTLQIYFMLRGGWLPQISNELEGTFESVADQAYEFDPVADMQEYYRAFPQEQFEVLFDKLVVNLRRYRPQQTPMATFGLYINVDSQDTAIEIKDREKEFIDLVSRTVEGFTFKEVVALEGKRRLKTQIRKELNSVLNQGRVERVYFKHFIAKP